jgi:hypothetical protein
MTSKCSSLFSSSSYHSTTETMKNLARHYLRVLRVPMFHKATTNQFIIIFFFCVFAFQKMTMSKCLLSSSSFSYSTIKNNKEPWLVIIFVFFMFLCSNLSLSSISLCSYVPKDDDEQMFIIIFFMLLNCKRQQQTLARHHLHVFCVFMF